MCTALLWRCIIAVIEKSTNYRSDSLISISYRHAQGLTAWPLPRYESNYSMNWIIGKLYCTVLLCMSYIIDFKGFYIMFKNLSLVLKWSRKSALYETVTSLQVYSFELAQMTINTYFIRNFETKHLSIFLMLCRYTFCIVYTRSSLLSLSNLTI